MLILIFGSKSGFGDDFGQSDRKKLYFTSLFGNTPLRNRGTPEDPGDQKLFERVCYTIRLYEKSQSFSFLHSVSELY